MSTIEEPLRVACSNGDIPKLRGLLQPQAGSASLSDSNTFIELDPSVTSEMLVIAVQSVAIETVHFILHNYPRTTIEEEVIRYAIHTHSILLYKEFLSHDSSIINMTIYDGRESQLGRAISTGASPEYIEFLLSSGAYPNPHTSTDALSPLGLAALPGQTRSMEICVMLLKHGAELNGSGALAANAKFGRTDVVEYLLRQGADVNDAIVQSGHGDRWPALHAAVEAGQGDIVRVLLGWGADRNILDGKGKTALAVAEKRGDAEIVNLLQNGDDDRQVSSSGSSG